MSTLALHGGPPVRSTPFPAWPPVDLAGETALLDVLHDGRWGRHLGGRVEAFEQRFAAFQGARYGIAVANGSVAIRLALHALGIRPGDEVIVPPITFYTTAASVLEVNAVPVFADIHPETYCLDPAAVAAALTRRTRAILPVHFAGQAAALDALAALAAPHRIPILEDAAHAHAAEYKGRRLGSFGALSTFSFQSTKNLTSGEGGMILTSDAELERTCRALHTCGRYPESAWYEHQVLGGNYRLTEFQAALLLAQLDRLEEQAARREANGLHLNALLGELPGIRPLTRGHGETRHAYHLYIFRYDPAAFDGLPRQTFLRALYAEGVPCSAGYERPLHRQPVFARRAFGPFALPGVDYPDYAQLSLPVAEQSCREACWLPQSVLLDAPHGMHDVAAAIAKIFEQRSALL